MCVSCFAMWTGKIKPRKTVYQLWKKLESRMEWDRVAKIKKNKRSEEITDVGKSSRI